jgi:hypothetical protein
MAGNVRKALVEGGVVTNIALFDADDVPSWAAAWVDSDFSVSVGDVYDGVSFVPREQPIQLSEEIRAQRDKLLADSDWVVTKAVEQNAQDGLGIQVPQVWLAYRQALRDIPQQAGFPDNVTWPTKPA